MNALVLLFGLAFLAFLLYGVAKTQDNMKEIARAKKYALEDQTVRVLEARASQRNLFEYLSQDQKRYHVVAEPMSDCGEVIDDDFWVDPAAVRHADKIIPPGFRAVVPCVVCNTLATHYIEKIEGSDIVRRCIMEGCNGTWRERK